MHDLRERMTQALYSAAPNIGEAVMEYVSELDAHLAAMREALEAVPEMCIAAGDVRVSNARGLYEQGARDAAEYQVMLDKWAAALAPDAGKKLLERLRKAEARLAEAQDKARLQRALDAINTGDYYIELCGEADDWNIQLKQTLGQDTVMILFEANGFTPLEAAEAAAQWVESQKEAAHE